MTLPNLRIAGASRPLIGALAAIAFLCATPGVLQAQNGLREIPDTSIEAALAGFKLPEGAEINLFAGDPQISKPVQMNWDAQGRLWMVSSGLYPQIKPGQSEGDRVLILEDADGDGVVEKVTTFADDLHIPTAVIPGDGGAYVANSTEVLFLEDSDGDGKADRRRVLLSGFGTEDTHHLLHTFRHGPEGLLYMNQSIYIHSHVETPYGVRRLLGGGMWHFRPETRRLEVFYKGLINPWGSVIDRWGQSFASDGAGHEGLNFVFPRAVFRTSPGASRVLPGLNPGQPKHCGLEIVSGTHVPEDWRGDLLAPDFRGHRINRFRLQDSGSGYVSTQREDLLASTHRAFRPIDVRMGPDGAIYVADWYNPIIQHGEVDFRDPRRDHEHGRIWRITFKDRPLVARPDIVGRSVPELFELLKAEEDWTRHFAKRELRHRGKEAVLPHLAEWVTALPEDAPERERLLLEALWTAQSVDHLDEALLRRLLAAEDARVRAAALRVLYFRHAEVADAFALAVAATQDANPRVRLWSLCVLAQLDDAETVSEGLSVLDQEMDETLDFALWSLCREHEERWASLAESGNPFGDARQYFFAVKALGRPIGVDRVLASLGKEGAPSVPEIADFVSRVGDAEQLGQLLGLLRDGQLSEEDQVAVLRALEDAARLRKLKPAGDASPVLAILREAEGDRFSEAAALAGRWKEAAAREPLEAAFLAADDNEARARSAMAGLRSLGGGEVAQLFERTARDGDASFRLRSLAVVGRTGQKPEAGAELAVEVLKASPDGKDPFGVYDAFLATKQGPGALEKALQNQQLPQGIALTGMQKASSAATKPDGLIAVLQKAGELKPMKVQLSPEEMETMMQAVAEKGDPHRGERIYRRAALNCQVCHAIGGAGGLIGPDMVSIGSSAPVDYLIESMLEPSKKIKEGYHTNLVTTKSGAAFSGGLAGEDANEVIIRDAAGQEHRIPKADIAQRTVSPVSLMPPGLTASLREDEFVDLIRFLSELGKEGDFKTTPNRYVRYWDMLEPHERTRDAIGHYGPVIFAEDLESYTFRPGLSLVDGGLPTDEMPDVKGRGSNRWAVGRFYLQVDQPGQVAFRFPRTKDQHFFLDEKAIELPNNAKDAVVTVDVKAGLNRFTVAGLQGYGLDAIKVELVDADENPARARILTRQEWP